MKFKIKYADQIVGIFIILVILAISLLFIFMGVNQRWFEKNYMFYTTFLSANGININMPIKLKGFEIGKIKSINLSDRNDVEVEFYIYGEYIDKIYPNTIIQKSSGSVVGFSSEIIIHLGKETTHSLPEFSFIPSFNSEEAQEFMREGLVTIMPTDTTITRLLNQVDPIVFKINTLLDNTNMIIKTFANAVTGKDKGDIGKIVKNTEQITEELNTILVEVSVEIKQLIANIENLTSNFSSFSNYINEPEGLLPKLAGENSSIAALLDDNTKLYGEIEAILENINMITYNLDQFSEFLNYSTPQLTGILEEGRGALREGTAVMEGLKNNPLLKKGISERKAPETLQSNRQEDF